MTAPVFRPVGDRALLVEFGTAISDAVHDRVLALDRALTASPFHGFVEAVPGMVNLLVVFDPVVLRHAEARDEIERRLASAGNVAHKAVRHHIPVCYEDAFAPDLAEVADRTGLSPEDVVTSHLSGDYAVYMYGFAPGYAYLANLPRALHLDRKPKPVRGVPAGSIIIAGGQCIVTTLTMPTGWWVIGRSPASILTGNAAKPFLFDVGDRVTFQRTGLDDL